MNQKGFTMLELLIAAAIVGVLAFFAARGYRNTLGEAYIEDGKNRVRAVATAIQQFQMDYPGYSFSGGEDLVKGKSACSVGVAGTAQVLINCGYLDNRPWSDGHISIEVCGISTTKQCGKATLGGRLVCLTGKDAKFPDYNGKNKYIYCESATKKQTCINGCAGAVAVAL